MSEVLDVITLLACQMRPSGSTSIVPRRTLKGITCGKPVISIFQEAGAPTCIKHVITEVSCSRFLYNQTVSEKVESCYFPSIFPLVLIFSVSWASLGCQNFYSLPETSCECSPRVSAYEFESNFCTSLSRAARGASGRLPSAFVPLQDPDPHMFKFSLAFQRIKPIVTSFLGYFQIL